MKALLIASLLLLSTPVAADLLVEAQESKNEAAQQDEYAHAGIAKLYEEFNATLRQIGPGDSEGLSRFFTKANRAANQCAFFAFGCRSSSRAFNQAITLTEYEIVSIETNANRSVDLMLLGTNLGDGDNTENVRVGLVVNWLFEEKEWRIDSIMKGPPDRDFVKRRFSIKNQRPQPVAPKD